MRRLLWLIVMTLLIAFGGPAKADHRVVVQLKKPTSTIETARTRQIGRSQAACLRILRGTKFTVHRKFEHLPYMAIEVDDAGLERLEDSGKIVAVTPDYEFFPTQITPQLNQSIPLIGADKLHAQGIRGKGFAVAVIDTGVDLGHLAFKDAAGQSRIVAEACFTLNQCPNGQSTMIGPGAGAAIAGHGTHVTGICCGNQAPSIIGVAPEADIVAVQVFTRRSNGGISASFSDLIAAVEWVSTVADDLNIAAINMSLGTGPIAGDCTARFQAMSDAADLAIARGTGVIAASGNNSSTTGVSSPGCIKNHMAVGCTAKNDSVCPFSNRGPEMEIWAPGRAIVSARLGGGTSNLSGTSMSSPHVAGSHPLVRRMFPTFTHPDQVRALLIRKGTIIAGKPRLRLDDLAAPPPPPPDPNQPDCPDCPCPGCDTCCAPPPPPPPQCPDADADGEIDQTDRCPNTRAGAIVDDAGCSHAQWCMDIVTDSWRDKGACVPR